MYASKDAPIALEFVQHFKTSLKVYSSFRAWCAPKKLIFNIIMNNVELDVNPLSPGSLANRVTLSERSSATLKKKTFPIFTFLQHKVSWAKRTIPDDETLDAASLSFIRRKSKCPK